jgi:hypothetical protein
MVTLFATVALATMAPMVVLVTTDTKHCLVSPALAFHNLP